MLMLYFSGTGNSKYIARLFTKKTNAQCHSIEEELDYKSLINEHDTIAFCYPIYGSCVPRIMREFVALYKTQLSNKKLIIFCTQLFFSGDGACAFTRLLPGSRKNVLYAEHFNMPNNISNFDLFPIKNGVQANKYLIAAEKKMNIVCKNIKNGIVKKRGFSNFSWLLGKVQSAFWPTVEEQHKSSARTDSDCIKCGACVKLCPSKNLSLDGNGINQHDNCIICYRCVNACPKKSITVLIHKKPKVQYKGVQL